MRSTPFLHLDSSRLDANIARAASTAADCGLVLRPHAKTHKCREIADRQLAAGAVGLTVATLTEAEVFADNSSVDLFIAFPVWVDQEMAPRVRALQSGRQLWLGADSMEALRQMAHVGVVADVMVEVDSGMHRSGVQADDVVPLAREAAALGHTVRGVFTFPGHSYHPSAREQAAREEAAALGAAVDALREAGFTDLVVSGASSPSFDFSDGNILTEARPGVYVVGDAQQWELGACDADDIALTCVATVVSHAGGRVVANAGSKVLGADRPAWASGYGRVLDHPQARIVALSEHHATINWPGALPAIGQRIHLVPNHACNAINLADEFIVDDGQIWRIDARGCNS